MTMDKGEAAFVALLVTAFTLVVVLLAWRIDTELTHHRQAGEFSAVCDETGGRQLHYGRGPDLCISDGGRILVVGP